MEQSPKESGEVPKEDVRLLVLIGGGILLFTAALLGGRLYQDSKPFSEAKSALESQLKDPYSVKYSNLDTCPAGNGVTGDYNAKNSFGAYTGNEPFLYVNGHLAMVGDRNFSDFLDLCYYGKIRTEEERSIAIEEAPGR